MVEQRFIVVGALTAMLMGFVLLADGDGGARERGHRLTSQVDEPIVNTTEP